MTRPLPPKGLRTSEISSNSCIVSWLLPDVGHSCLRGFQIQIKFHDGKIFKDFAVFKTIKSHHVDGLQPCHDYVITVTGKSYIQLFVYFFYRQIANHQTYGGFFDIT